MKTSLVWTSPFPERTIAVAMRRCYSTKTIEEIEAELDLKGAEYWKYLITRAMQDKSLDVLEHFTLTLLVEGMDAVEAGKMGRRHPYMRSTQLDDTDWLVSLNARTLVEIWRDVESKPFAEAVISELDKKEISPLFNSVAFGDRVHAR